MLWELWDLRSRIYGAFISAALLLVPIAAGGQSNPQGQCIASAAASGTPNAITIPALPCALTTNLLILTASGANTITTPTLQPLGLPAQTIVRPDGTALHTGDIAGAGFKALLNPTGSVWVLLNPNSGGGGGGGSPGGNDTNVQFNCTGSFCGSNNLEWNSATNTLTVVGSISQSVTLTGTINTGGSPTIFKDASPNFFAVTNTAATDNAGHNIYGAFAYLRANSTNVNSPQNGIGAGLQVDAAANGNQGPFSGSNFWVFGNTNLGGTNITAVGLGIGVSGSCFLSSTSTFWIACSGAQFGTDIAVGANVQLRAAITGGSIGADGVQGSIVDAIISLSNESGATVFWKNGIYFSTINGAYPFNNASDVIGSAAGTVHDVINASAMTVAHDFLEGPSDNFLVDGSGNLYGNSGFFGVAGGPVLNTFKLNVRVGANENFGCSDNSGTLQCGAFTDAIGIANFDFLGNTIAITAISSLTVNSNFAVSATGKIITAASATGGAFFNLPHGVAPTSPVNGDLWTTTAGLFARINGATVGPFGSGAVSSVSNSDGTLTISPVTGAVVASINLGNPNIWAALQTIEIDNFGSTSTSAEILQNTAAAAAGAQQWSPRLKWLGAGWKTNATAASQEVDWIAEVVPVQGAANPTSYLSFSSQINSAGYNQRFALFSSGAAGLGSTTDPGTAGVFNVSTGFRIGNAAASGNVLRGNGTNFISAQLAAADLSNGVTGSGAVVLATSPALTTPNLGTPSAATLTNATGLPIASGVSGLGTGVAAALGNAVNASGGIISPTPSAAGDTPYWNGTTWAKFAGNASGTQCYTQNASGVPAWAPCGSGGSPGGANTDVQFNNSSAFGGDSGFTYAGSGQATLALGTITANAQALNVTATWNNSGVTFDAALLVNITTTANAADSVLADIQNNGKPVFKVFAASIAAFNRGDVAFFGNGNSGGGAGDGVILDIVRGAGGHALEFNSNSAEIGTVGGINTANSTVGFYATTSGALGWGTWNTVAQALFTSPASAIVQMGDHDAAAPVAQTFAIQNVSAGNSNVAGVSWTFRGSLSTGTGASGDIVFQTGGTGAGSTAQNSAVTAFTIKGATQNIIAAAHILDNGTAPVVSACGTSPVQPTGSDVTGKFTAGSGTVTSCLVTFNKAWGSAPACMISSASAITSLTVTTTTTTMTIGGSSLTSFVIGYHCFSTAQLEQPKVNQYAKASPPANDNHIGVAIRQRRWLAA